MIEMEDLPFGPPPENYSYRCSDCQHEYTVNEAIVDAAIGWAEFDGDYEKEFMPILGCPNCNREALEYAGD